MTQVDVQSAFEEHKDVVHRFAWRMTNSSFAAEDITQDVFTLLLRKPALFDPERGSIRSFLLGVARNLARKWLHQQGRWNELDEEEFVAEPAAIEREEVTEIVSEAVRSLPPLQREVLLLAHYEGFSLHEISLAVGAEVGAVKARLHRARENLKRQLAFLAEQSARSLRAQ